MSYEEHQPYYDNIHRLISDLPLDTLSYVDHKMLFDKEQQEELHQVLGGEEWVKTILDNYDRHSHAGFSEVNYMAISSRRKSDILGYRKRYVIRNLLTTRHIVVSGKVRAGR